tara:strand:- start:5235 stop:5912 length:678 start_codon:yes stop_codon:yes gene_type:complete
VLNLIKLGTVFTLILASSTFAGANVNWQINEDLIDESTEELASEKNHLFQIGVASKNVNNLTLNSKDTQFSLDQQNMPGLNIHYAYLLTDENLETSIYSHLGYFTKYNDLGANGYADLNLFDLYLGMDIGKTFYSKLNIKPHFFAGLGYSYFSQRGDVKEVSADESFTERELGVGVDLIFDKKDSFPDSWSLDYTLSFRLTDFASINGEDDIDGQKISANFGVLL